MAAKATVDGGPGGGGGGAAWPAPASAHRDLHVILDAVPIPIFFKDAAGVYRGCNRAFEEYIGRPRSEIVGRTVHELAPSDLAEVYHAADLALLREHGVQTYESQVRYADGSRRDVLFNKATFPGPAGEVAGLVGTILDVTDRKAAEARLQHQAFHDALTGLPNRALFMDRLGLALAAARRGPARVALVYLDLDRFKMVNDTLGHHAGDRLLQEVGRRLAAAVRDSDTMARMGGDEFCAIVPDVVDGAEAAAVAHRLAAALRPVVELQGHDLHVTASVGVALHPTDGEDPHTLLRCADAAMYQAKESGPNAVRLFSPGQRDDRRLDFESKLHGAVERGELTLHYQPQTHLATSRLVGFEALLRWNHPTLGQVMPDRIIPVAEESGLVLPIGAWVLREACRQAAAWQRGGRNLRVAVNVSARQLERGDFPDLVRETLRETGLEPALLEVELTESVAMREESIARMASLRDTGVRIAIDDFGTGYSSLSCLRRMPVEALKIDRSFVREVEDGSPLLEPIIRLAHGLGLRVVAEGVETHRQLRRLHELGCDLAQGYALGGPMPASLVEARLAAGP